MNRRSVLLSLSLLALHPVAAAQSASPPPPGGRGGAGMPAERIEHPGIQRFELAGAEGEAPWLIQLAIPEGRAPAGGFRTLFMVDGDAAFPLAWRALQAAAADGEPLVLVGIGYPGERRFNVERRYYDLTPLTPPENMRMRNPDLRTGGNDAFLAFIDGKLTEEVGRRVAIDPAGRTLFGHSLGGLFSLHALFQRPGRFRTHVAADPSIWWNEGAIMTEFADFQARPRQAGTAPATRVLIETSGGGRRSVGTAPLQLAAPALEVAAGMAATPGYDVYFRARPEENHGSLMAPAVADAVALARGQVPAGVDRPAVDAGS